MKTSVKITEKQLQKLVNEMNEPKEVNEDLFGGIKDLYQGVKGFARGEGYSYFKYLSNLQRLMSKLKKLDTPNHKIMLDLNTLKNNINSSKMPGQKKLDLIGHIDDAINYFNYYVQEIDKIETLTKQSLN
jgi:hypothetical protein